MENDPHILIQSIEEEITNEIQQASFGISLMPDNQLKELAKDIVAGRVFTDRQVRKSDVSMLSSIFMVLVFMQGNTSLVLSDAGLLYEYLDKAGPRCVNGYPTFMSVRYVHKHDIPRLFETCDKVQQALASI